jgi:hypothetical protein
MTNITPQNTGKNSGIENLKPWAKGVSGNPNGRPPKEFSFTSAMKEFLAEVDPDKKKERKQLLIEQTFKQAMRGDSTLIKMMWNYFDGMPQGSSPQVAVQVNNFTKTPEEYEEMAVEFLRGKGYQVNKL